MYMCAYVSLCEHIYVIASFIRNIVRRDKTLFNQAKSEISQVTAFNNERVLYNTMIDKTKDQSHSARGII